MTGNPKFVKNYVCGFLLITYFPGTDFFLNITMT